MFCNIIYINRKSSSFWENIREGAVVVIVSSLFGSINGLFLSNIKGILKSYPGIIILYPALINALGNIGSIIGSTMTTEIALGLARSFKEEVVDALEFILKVEAPAVFMHIVFAGISFLLAGGSTSEANLIFLLRVALISNLMSFLVISFFALGLAFLAFQRGLNPDNVVIPFITALSDTAGTLALRLSLIIARIF